ncbi:MAG: hypothetical protein AAF423_05295 [Pseudomonadota bacterium]
MFRKLDKILKIFVFALLAGQIATTSAFSRTYLVNGLVSAVPFIGYGMNNLGKRLPGSKVFSYITSIEGNRIIKPNIIADIEERYKRNPSEPVNLIGISYGANLVTEIASTLASKGIPVNYLATIEGTSMKSIKANVRTADNFTCTGSECSKKRVRLASGNGTTKLAQFSYNDGHIDLGNNKKVHSRITGKVR